jgi:chromosome segregation ATPase
MGAEEKNMNDILSRIIAELFEKSKGGEELSAKIRRLREEIRKVIESEDTVFGKFRVLVESFREIIPDEKQRYTAAIKALSTTSKLSRQEIIAAVNNQLEELKILEKGILPALPGWRDEFAGMEAKTQELRSEIAKLREILGRLESEEKELLTGMAARKKEMEHVEKAVGEVFTVIGAEITYIKKKIEEFTAESAAAPRDSGKSDVSRENQEDAGQESEMGGSSAPLDAEWQKKCPMCGGRMNFHSTEEMWLCYSCAYEELTKDEGQGIASPASNENQDEKKESAPSDNQPSGKKKTCPACRKKMEWYPFDKAWRCPFCDYERSI